MIKKLFRHLAVAAVFPVYSLFSPRLGFTCFFPGKGGWWAYTRGRTFRVRHPGRWVMEYFRRFVPPRGGLVFDVGGELGFETEQFANLVGLGGRVFVFECFPSHIERLKKLAGTYPNITVVERACWDQATTLEFFTGHTDGSNTAIPDATGQRGQPLADFTQGKIKVTAERLDALWKQYTTGATVDFLKMDIEGAEYEALAGAPEMLRRTKNAVIAAYHIRDGVRTADRVADILKAAGFVVEIGDNHHVYAHRD